MPVPPTNPEPVVYQLRVVLRGVSPLIWRRLLVRSDSTIADLHASLQLVFGWSDEHLNRFVIHGREYGGIGFRDNPRHVHLVDLGLRVRERFDDLAEVFQRWYPAFVTPAESAATEEFAA
jgi:hypothetical protein